MIANAPASPVLGMTPGHAIELLQRDLGMTSKELQAVLETTPRNIERWTTEQAHPQTKARVQLADLMAFYRHLESMFTDWEGARSWLNAPSRHLGNFTPMDAIRLGHLDRARIALVALDSGVYV